MAKMISDSELAARIRRQSRAGSQRRREKAQQEGKQQLGGLWIPEATKERALTVAQTAAVPLSVVVAWAIDRLPDLNPDMIEYLRMVGAGSIERPIP